MRKYIQLISRPATARDPRRGFQLQWKLDSRFHFFGGIKYSSSSIPDSKARILDSTCKKFSDSGIQIPLHETIVNRTLRPTAGSSEIPGEHCRRLTETSSPVITDQLLCIRSPLTASCCYCSLSLSKHQETSSSIPL